MKKEKAASTIVVYIHGKGGSAGEAEHYRPLFPDCDVVGLEYRGSAPWDAGREIEKEIRALKAGYDSIILIANSIGAYFSMNADIDDLIEKAFFISPVVDMEKLIAGMMSRAGVTEATLRSRKTIQTSSGEELSWDYLSYVREHPVEWNAPTEILYGSEDALTDCGTIRSFSLERGAGLTVMEGGEHWFHTEEQLRFLDDWIKSKKDH